MVASAFDGAPGGMIENPCASASSVLSVFYRFLKALFFCAWWLRGVRIVRRGLCKYMLYVNPSPPLYTEACAAFLRMKKPSPALIIRRLRGVSLGRLIT